MERGATILVSCGFVPSRDGHQIIANRRGRGAPNETLDLADGPGAPVVPSQSRYQGAAVAVDDAVFSDPGLVGGRCRATFLGYGVRFGHGRFSLQW